MFVAPGGAVTMMFCSPGMQAKETQVRMGQQEKREQKDVFALQAKLALSHFCTAACPHTLN